MNKPMYYYNVITGAYGSLEEGEGGKQYQVTNYEGIQR
jgi:hypothetical protein